MTNIKGSENEAAAARAIFTIRRLQTQYASKHQGKFAPNFDELINAANLDGNFTGKNPVVNGYVFDMKVIEPTNQKPAFYSVNADPHVSESLGGQATRHFYYDSVIQITKSTGENRPAQATDPAM